MGSFLHGLSQNDMADAAKIPRRTYQNIEYKRTQQIPIDYVISIAKALDTTVNELLEGTTAKTVPQKKHSPADEILKRLDAIEAKLSKQSPELPGPRGDLERLIASLPDSALADAVHRIEMLIAGLPKDNKSSSRGSKR